MHFVGLFFVFIIENARSKKQNKKKKKGKSYPKLRPFLCRTVTTYYFHYNPPTFISCSSPWIYIVTDRMIGVQLPLDADFLSLSLSLSLQRHYSPGWASASFKSFLHPSPFRATIVQFLYCPLFCMGVKPGR